MKMTTTHVEEAVLRYFGKRYVSVPNVYWGLGFRHELDILAVNKESKFATEVEIKISKSDLLADKKKLHGHSDPRVKYLYFAVPKELEDFALEHIPERAGLIVCEFIEDFRFPTMVGVVRRPKARSVFRPFNEEEYMKLLELGVMRIQKMKLDALKCEEKKQKTKRGVKK